MSRKYSDVELVEVWDRRQAGESSPSICRRVGRSAAAIRALVESSGGCGRDSGAVVQGSCRWLSARRSLEVWLLATRCGRSHLV